MIIGEHRPIFTHLNSERTSQHSCTLQSLDLLQTSQALTLALLKRHIEPALPTCLLVTSIDQISADVSDSDLIILLQDLISSGGPLSKVNNQDF